MTISSPSHINKSEVAYGLESIYTHDERRILCTKSNEDYGRYRALSVSVSISIEYT